MRTTFIAAMCLLLGMAASASAVTLHFTPNVGVVSTEGPNQVVSVSPSTLINFTVQVTSASEALTTYQLNFVASDIAAGQLVLNSWVNNGAFNFPSDTSLSTPGNTLVAAGTLSTVPVPATLGTFNAAAPAVFGDYLLTVDSQLGNFNDTTITGAAELPIVNYGNTIVRVVPEPSAAYLLAVGAGALVGFLAIRRRVDAGRFATLYARRLR